MHRHVRAFSKDQNNLSRYGTKNRLPDCCSTVHADLEGCTFLCYVSADLLTDRLRIFVSRIIRYEENPVRPFSGNLTHIFSAVECFSARGSEHNAYAASRVFECYGIKHFFKTQAIVREIHDRCDLARAALIRLHPSRNGDAKEAFLDQRNRDSHRPGSRNGSYGILHIEGSVHRQGKIFREIRSCHMEIEFSSARLDITHADYSIFFRSKRNDALTFCRSFQDFPDMVAVQVHAGAGAAVEDL